MRILATEDTEVTEKSSAVAERLSWFLSVFSELSVAKDSAQ